MNNKKILLGIFLVFIVLISLNMAFAEDISQNDTITIAESDNIQTASQYTISAGSNSTTIQNTINDMSDGDILNFENGEYTDICIYIDKGITIIVGENGVGKSSILEGITYALFKKSTLNQNDLIHL